MRPTTPIDPSTIPAVNTNVPTTGQGMVVKSGLQTGCGTLYFLNKSNIGIWIVFEDGSTGIIPAWWARPFTMQQKTNQLWLTQAYILNSTAGNPISQLFLEVYQANEDASGLYSGPIPYQQNLGNNVPINATATSVVNDGNAAGTTIVEATAVGDPSSDVLIKNNGSARFRNSVEAINLVPVQDGVGRLLGIFGYDGTNNHLAMQCNTDGTVAFHFGGIIGGFSIFSGTGSGTFNHGLGTTPRLVLPIQHAVGSQTMGYDSENATTVHITAGNGAAWVALAIA